MPTYYCCEVVGRVFEVNTFSRHSGNTKATIGVREVGSDGAGPAFFAERSRLSSTEMGAIKAAKPALIDLLIEHAKETARVQAANAKLLALLDREANDGT